MTTDEILQRADDARALIDTLEAVEMLSAPLRARYGPFGTFEHDRKILLATLRDEYRVGATTRISNDSLDDMAHADERYQRFIESAVTERTKLAEYDAQRVALDHRISLAKALLYTHSRLAGLA
ncbi:MAG: hypothetical protein ACYC3L_01240 [Gemmatimonadaceae bacterium]